MNDTSNPHSAFIAMLLGNPKKVRIRSARGASRQRGKAKRAMKSYGPGFVWAARRKEKAKRQAA